MAGQINLLIEKIVQEKSQGNKALVGTIKAKIIMKGVLVNKYNKDSEDDSKVIDKLKQIGFEMGVTL